MDGMPQVAPDADQRPVSDEFSLALGRETARALVDDPDAVLTAARRNLAFMRRVHGDGSADSWFDRWERLLDGPIDEVVRVLSSAAEPDRLLRQNTPFAGVVPERHRQEILRTVRDARSAQGVRRCGENSSNI